MVDVDCDAFRVIWFEVDVKLLLVEVAPPGPVNTIETGLPPPLGGGGGVTGGGSCVLVNGLVSQADDVTPEPYTIPHAVFGPPAHPHQFCVAFTVPAPKLSTPVGDIKLFRKAATCPEGALKARAIIS